MVRIHGIGEFYSLLILKMCVCTITEWNISPQEIIFAKITPYFNFNYYKSNGNCSKLKTPEKNDSEDCGLQKKKINKFIDPNSTIKRK